MAFFLERAEKKSFFFDSTEVDAAQPEQDECPRRWFPRTACVRTRTHTLDFESAVNGELIHLQVERIFSRSWHEQQPYSGGMKALFNADLQAAFRAKGNFDPSSRPPAAGEPIHLAGRYPRGTDETAGVFFFLSSLFSPLGSISFLSESLFKEKKNHPKSSDWTRRCGILTGARPPERTRPFSMEKKTKV